MGHATLSATSIGVSFAGLRALDGVDFLLTKGELVGVIGPNGAGKTTLMNVLSGFIRPTQGQVTLQNTDVTRWPPFRLARAGVVRTFQNVRPFHMLTVLENIQVGSVGVNRSVKDARAQALDLVEIVGLGHMMGVRAGALSYGDERRLALARALATSPIFLLLDEPAAGLSEAETDHLIELIRHVRSVFDCGVAVIEHDMRFIMGLCERIQVLDHGKTISEGTPGKVRGDPLVREAYLGKDRADEGMNG